MTSKPARLLVIAGSDSSGGAGIQADLKTAAAFSVYASTVVTAVTAQDTITVRSVFALPASLVRDQIACCLEDIGADAIKIGMLASAEVVSVVLQALTGTGIPTVLDPVVAATSGTTLLDEEALHLLRGELLPSADIVTPNIPELELLAGAEVRSREQVVEAAQLLRRRGVRAVLAKGGHASGAIVEDTLVWEGGIEIYAYPRIDTPHTHGTGCTLATAIACGLAQGWSLPIAVGRAREFVQAAIIAAPGLGRGHGPLDHMSAGRRFRDDIVPD